MKSYRNGQIAPLGLYIGFRKLDLAVVGADGDVIEGRSEEYRRVPTLLALLLCPLLGGAFVLLFPLLVIAAVLGFAGSWAARRVTEFMRAHAYLGRTSWVATASYLKQGEHDEGETAAGTKKVVELDALRAEVDARVKQRDEDSQG